MNQFNDPGLGRVVLRGGVSEERGGIGIRVLLGMDIDTPGRQVRAKIEQLQKTGRELNITSKFKPDRVVMELRRATR